MSVPGIGPLCAMAIQAFAPPLESFRRGRDFAAWLGLVPRQSSTGGKPKLGRISKMGQRDLRWLVVTGVMATVGWAARRGKKDPWLARMLARKPRMLVAVALANRTARIAWALMTNDSTIRPVGSSTIRASIAHGNDYDDAVLPTFVQANLEFAGNRGSPHRTLQEVEHRRVGKAPVEPNENAHPRKRQAHQRQQPRQQPDRPVGGDRLAVPQQRRTQILLGFAVEAQEGQQRQVALETAMRRPGVEECQDEEMV